MVLCDNDINMKHSSQYFTSPCTSWLPERQVIAELRPSNLQILITVCTILQTFTLSSPALSPPLPSLKPCLELPPLSRLSSLAHKFASNPTAEITVITTHIIRKLSL